MKIIHCADIHLGSKIGAKLKDISNDRRTELRTSFKRMVEYAVKEGIKVILLAGDVFDSESPSIKDREFFYDVVRSHSEIDFLYLRGNHDCTEYFADELPNIKMFGYEWTSYEYDDVVITGIEMNSTNMTSLYSTLKLDQHKKNIVTIHGEVSDTTGKDRINIKKLKHKGIDYLALGHVHKYQDGELDDRGVYVNPGCLEGRGFDELGKKGFVVAEIATSIKYKFIPCSIRSIVEEEIDISAAENNYDALKIVESNIQSDSKDIVRIVLTGDVGLNVDGIEQDVIVSLSDKFYFLTVKDKTNKKIDISLYEHDMSFKGEFIRTVYEKNDMSDEEKKNIIMLGLKFLQGREID